ncbi:MAG: hypothetical protein K0Q91_1882 [Fibrobacteria bacterium]|jgi:hypothetical protein|nr:hypothetical protein [Fibrobacteria bacterium]
MRNPSVRLLSALALACAGLVLTQCAPLRAARAPSSAKLYAGPSESLFLRIQPFDSVVKAELSRAGLDPVRFEEEVHTELRYRLSLRGQEEAADSAGAEVVLTLRFKHLQPGTGQIGMFGAVWMETLRKGAPQWTEWTWRQKARNNVPPIHVPRHLARVAVDQVLDRLLAARPRPKEPPPPLQLL